MPSPKPKPTAKVTPKKAPAKGAAGLAPTRNSGNPTGPLAPKPTPVKQSAREMFETAPAPQTALQAVRRLVDSPIFIDSAFRQSGRTTRMLETAAEAARKGAAVLIVVLGEHRATEVLGRPIFYPGTTINVRAHDPKNPLFDWATLDPIAPEYKGWKVFVDHDVAFSQHRHILDLLGWANNTASNESAT